MRQHVTTLLVLPLLALPAACTTPDVSAAPQPSTATSTPDPEQSYWPGQDEVMAAATVIDDHANAHWSHAHAGVALDLPGQAVDVHRIPTHGFDAEIRSMLPNMKLRFVDAKHSAATLNGWVQRIFDDRPYWQNRGVLIHGIGSEMGKHVDVEVANPERDARKITARYPHMELRVKKGWPAVDLTGRDPSA
jgi:hypothetical protein